MSASPDNSANEDENGAPEEPASINPWPDLAGRLAQDGHLLPVRVYYEDTDFSGLVYHANFLKFMERGRSDFLRLLGVHHHEIGGLKAETATSEGNGPMARPDMAFAVRQMTIEFLKPAHIDEVLVVKTGVKAITGARLILGQAVCREDETLITADVTVAVINKTGRPLRLDPAFRALFAVYLD